MSDPSKLESVFNVLEVSSSTCFLERRLFSQTCALQMLHSEDRRFSIVDAFLCAVAAETWSHGAYVSRHCKNKNQLWWLSRVSSSGILTTKARVSRRSSTGHRNPSGPLAAEATTKDATLFLAESRTPCATLLMTSLRQGLPQEKVVTRIAQYHAQSDGRGSSI